MPVVRMKTSMAASNFSYAPGDLIMVSDEVAAAWVEVGHAEAYQEEQKRIAELSADSTEAPDKEPQSVEVVSLEAFEALKAPEQKELLDRLGVEGDSSNTEKRVALYTEYLEANPPKEVSGDAN